MDADERPPDFSNTGVAAYLQGSRLTERQRQALDLAGDGLTYAEIGERLFISAATVKTHLAVARRVLHARDTVHAFRLAIRSGEIEP